MEVLTFTTVSILFKDLKAKYKRKISSKFTIKYKTLEECLKALSVIRNKCAHHTRFWNSRVTFAPSKKSLQEVIGDFNGNGMDPYVGFCIIWKFLKVMNRDSSWAIDLFDLIDQYLTPNNFQKTHMKFPDRFDEHALWISMYN